MRIFRSKIYKQQSLTLCEQCEIIKIEKELKMGQEQLTFKHSATEQTWLSWS